jgi:ATP-dependent Clp protease ATP-binding subunit ClpA
MFNIQLEIPVVEVNLTDSGKNTVCIPLMDTNATQMGVAARALAEHFGKSFQKSVMDKGLFQKLANYILPNDFEIRSLVMNVKSESFKKRTDFKPFKLRIQYILHRSDKGFWCILPTYGIETFTESEDNIENAVKELVMLDFVRNRRFDYVQSIIPTLWYKDFDLSYHKSDLEAYTLSEIDKLNEQKKHLLLDSAAKKLTVFGKVLFGFDKYLKLLTDAFSNRYNKNILLVGKSGVGKSALLYEFIFRSQHKKNFPFFWGTTAAMLIKELTNDIGWQENLSMICKELMERGDILYVKNLLELFEVGQYEGNSVSMAEYLRDFIAKGELSFVSECTDEEYAIIEARSPNFLHHFQVIRIEEPEANELEEIVLNKVISLSGKKNLKIEEEAIKETIRLNRRYTPYSGFPGKPIRFLESILMNTEARFKLEGDLVIVDRSMVIKSFCEETGMPVFMVDPDELLDITALQEFFKKNVFGQDHAVNILSDVLVSVKTALMRPGKPIASMLFAGPTGVGKTEMAKVLAEFMFGSRERMIRFDMSEYSSISAIARLTGEGYSTDGILTSAVRREPFCVLLFDELEKAHPLFNDLLLQMLGEGRLTDSQGKVVNFCSTIIIMTTNIGASKLQTRSVGWSDGISTAEISEHFENEVRKYFRPEIFNRIDQIIAFHPLSKIVMRKVVDREIQLLKNREGLQQRKLDIEITENLHDYLCELGYDTHYGARALQRTLREELIIPLAYRLNEYGRDEHLKILVDFVDIEIKIDLSADPMQFELLMEELAQNEYMDYASELRYNMAKLVEGQFFVHLLSDLDILKSQQKEMKEAFWADNERSMSFSNYLIMQEKVENQKALIEQLEMQMAMASMGMNSVNTKLYDNLKAWDKDFFNIKLDLYRLLDRDADAIGIGIYLNPKKNGDLKRLLDIYLPACDKNEFDCNIVTVWYRESLYNEIEELILDEMELNLAENNGVRILTEIKNPDSSTQFLVNRTKKAFYKKTYRKLEHNSSMRPDSKDDRLVGIELLIEGPGANLYFAHETMIHAFEYEDNKYETFFLQTSNSEINTPFDIHKKDFSAIQRKPRRKYDLNRIIDSEFEFSKKEIFPSQYAETMLKNWQKLFENHLNEIVR